MTKIYLVKGFTGEYEDSFDWVAKAFKTRAEAKEYHDSLLKIIRLHNVNSNDGQDYEVREELEADLSELDPKCRIDYNGVYYEIEEIQLSN